MTHTIFHSPNRQDIIRQRTPLVTVEAARSRRLAARRAVLTAFRDFEAPKPPQTPQPVAGIGTISPTSGSGGEFQEPRSQSGALGKLSGLDVLDLALSNDPSILGPRELTGFAASSLFGMVNPLAGLAFSGIAALTAADRTLSRQGSSVSGLSGQEFRGTNLGPMSTRGFAEQGLSVDSFGQVGSSNFSPADTSAFGQSAFGQEVAASDPTSGLQTGEFSPTGSISSFSDEGFGGEAQGGGFGGSGQATGGEDEGSAGSVGSGGGLGL